MKRIILLTFLVISLFSIASAVNVGNCADLQTEITNRADITLTADIDCSGTDFNGWYKSNLWGSNNYAGTFDGAGYTISNIVFTGIASDTIGLLPQVEGGNIINVNLNNVTHSSTSHGIFGALVGRTTTDLTIENISATNLSITCIQQCGGLIGRVQVDSSIKNLNVQGSVTSNGAEVGGVIGVLEAGSSGVVQNITYDMTVIKPSSATGKMGGMIGFADQIQNITDIDGRFDISSRGDFVGGLCGDCDTVTSMSNVELNGRMNKIQADLIMEELLVFQELLFQIIYQQI